MEITDILCEYQLSFSEGPDNDELLRNYFGPLGNPSKVLQYICFGLEECMKKSLGIFLHDCLLIPSNMKCNNYGSDMSIVVY